MFIFVSDKLISSELEELKVDGQCELVWAQIQIPRTSQLFGGFFYRPPDINDPEYINQLNTYLSRIPVSVYTWIGGDFNLRNIGWEADTIKPYANNSRLCQQFLTITKDHFLDQLVTEPTRVTEDTENILDLFFCNNSNLVNRVEVILGISDHECVYVESSLRPSKTVTPPRKVHLYHKANFESLKRELRRVKEELSTWSPLPPPKTCG